VGQELERFFSTLAVRSAALARHVVPEQRKSWAEVERVASLAAWAHGEWVRIRPFANGNGQ